MSDLEREVETNPYLVPYETLLTGFKTMKRERDEALLQLEKANANLKRLRDQRDKLCSALENILEANGYADAHGLALSGLMVLYEGNDDE